MVQAAAICGWGASLLSQAKRDSNSISPWTMLIQAVLVIGSSTVTSDCGTTRRVFGSAAAGWASAVAKAVAHAMRQAKVARRIGRTS